MVFSSCLRTLKQKSMQLKNQYVTSFPPYYAIRSKNSPYLEELQILKAINSFLLPIFQYACEAFGFLFAAIQLNRILKKLSL